MQRAYNDVCHGAGFATESEDDHIAGEEGQHGAIQCEVTGL